VRIRRCGDDDREAILAIINSAAAAYRGVIPVDRWHDVIADPTLADAILDRLVHNAYRIELKGESMRRRTATISAKTIML